MSIALTTQLSVGCGKDLRSKQRGNELTFSVEMAGESKASGQYTEETLTSLGQFNVTGYDDSGSKKIDDREAIRKSTFWQLKGAPVIWLDDETMTFWAYANMPSYASMTTSSDASATFSVTEIPAEATSQWDPLIGYYSGTGNNGNAPIVFHHPLTAVTFKTGDCGDPAYISAITGVTLKGVHKSGTAEVEDSGTGTISYSWTTSGTTDVTGAFSGDASAQPFLLIPQDLETDAVTIEVTVTLAEGGTQTMSVDLSSGKWDEGCHYFYVLDYNPIRPMDEALTVTLADWTYLTNKDGGVYFDVTFGIKPEE